MQAVRFLMHSVNTSIVVLTHVMYSVNNSIVVLTHVMHSVNNSIVVLTPVMHSVNNSIVVLTPVMQEGITRVTAIPSILFISFVENDAIEIASDEVAKNDADIEGQDLKSMIDNE